MIDTRISPRFRSLLPPLVRVVCLALAVVTLGGCVVVPARPYYAYRPAPVVYVR